MITTKKKYKIKDIFKDHWHLFLRYTYGTNKTMRHAILHEVGRILLCQNDSGYSLYDCIQCHILKYVPFICKSRFCNCCGALYSSNRAKTIKSKLYKCNHRHVIFTISEELRIYFLNDRKLLNILFAASSETLLSWVAGQQKAKQFLPGIVCVLHTQPSRAEYQAVCDWEKTGYSLTQPKELRSSVIYSIIQTGIENDLCPFDYLVL